MGSVPDSAVPPLPPMLHGGPGSEPSIQPLGAVHRGKQQSGMKQKLLSPAFIPLKSLQECVSPINQEMSRHDVIAITTIAAFSWNQGVFIPVYGRVD